MSYDPDPLGHYDDNGNHDVDNRPGESEHPTWEGVVMVITLVTFVIAVVWISIWAFR